MSQLMDIYKLGKELGHSGPELQDFVQQFQKQEREARAAERDKAKAEREKQEEQDKAKREEQEAKEKAARDEEFERQKELQEARLKHEADEREKERALEEKKLDAEKARLDAEKELEEARLEAEKELEEKKQKAKEEETVELRQANKLKEKELELKEKELNNKAEKDKSKGAYAKMPKLPAWQEKDDMDSYLSRFERYAQAQEWKVERWSINLSALLTGKALDVYYRMPTEEVESYEKVKSALLKNFQYTEEGFRQRLFNSKAMQAETASQFYTRIKGYMDRWITLSKINHTYEALRDLVVRNAFLTACHVNIATHLREFTDISNQDLIVKADVYMQAHGINNISYNTTAQSSSKSNTNKPSTKKNETIICHYCKKVGHKAHECRSIVCHFCNESGHIQPNCPKKKKLSESGSTPTSTANTSATTTLECFICKKKGHLSKDCWFKHKAASGVELSTETSQEVQEKPTEHKCNCPHAAMFVTDIKVDLPVDNIKEIYREGKNYTVCSKDCSAPVRFYNCYNLPTAECVLNNKEAMMLRDSGCTGVVVHEKFVSPQDYTGESKLILMIDGSVKTVPVANVIIDSPYFKGRVEAMVMKTPLYDLILGNIQNARNISDPDRTWTRSCMECYKEDKANKKVKVTKKILEDKEDSEEKVQENKQEESKEEVCMFVQTRNLKKMEKLSKQELIVEDINYKSVKQKSLSMEQQNDQNLKNIWNSIKKDGKSEVRRTKSGRVWYEVHDNILYRLYENPQKQHQNRKQIVLPVCRRTECIKLAHASILGGHMGVMKTLNRITSKFYWPGIQGDITRFCKSCDLCQRTVPKGRVGHVPLDEMPKIDVPFKRVAVDIVGPIYPASESGHRYILTMVDYATRYPEAIPLKTIDTITVAEAMLSVYSRVGLPEEVLSDLGTNFTSNLMKEICRLISVKQLTTTPYHPMCNGLCEKINGVLKTILKRLTSEKPKDWDRYLPAVLFAYREVPQESTGFSPFELLYGRDIRGPMSILKEVWLKEDEPQEKQNVYEYVLDLRDRIENTCELARKELEKSSRRYKRYYDRTAKSRILQEEDEVLLLLPTDSNKLLLQWKGPFKVTERTGKYTYKIHMKGKDRIFHINMLKQYFRPSDIEEQIPDPEILASMIVHEMEDEDVDLNLPGGQTETYKDIKYSPHLSEEQLQQAQTLVKEYQDIFTDKPGTTMMEEHRIQLTTSEPVKQRPYPLPYSMREIVNKEIKQMLEDGIIEKTDSPYASPIVMVKKTDGTYRLCIDYRKLNRITIFDGEPMPSMVDIFSGLIHENIFSKFDLSKGFWQIPVRECDKKKTAFVTQDGVYQFCKMPFGAINSTATFNRLMRKAYGFLDNVDSFVDDMLVHDKSWKEHLDSLRQVFEATRNAGLTIRPKKSQIGFQDLEFLGHNIGKGKITPQESKVQKILDTPPPKTKKQVRSFIGLIGYYRNFIPNFSLISAPLTDLTKKDLPTNVKWGDEHQKAFEKLKLLITQEPILKIPDFNKTFYLQTDASDQGVGAVLLQEYDGVKYPIAFYSKKFLDQHRRYSIIEKECLAIIWSLQKFEIYLYGREFILETDHQALTFIDQAKINNNRVMRWSLFLQNYRFRILAIKGQDNVIADYLSRSAF